MVVGREFWETFVSLSDNQLHHLISYAVAFVAFGLIGKWYLWPVLKGRTPRTALTPLLLCAVFRVNRLMFLIPTLVSTQLQKAFANLIGKTFPLEEAAAAHRYIHSRQNIGKVVLHVA